ncbi:MAG: UvrD-helicase domain-containing protein [Planctomycetes bacterium]|nr:UvrD-helicase domain-containing protein [Planctomycetota bacterium]MCB9910849.1 UvrD-helicase domain-containing protein [Planctomycetota bacterium]MCB9912219.1 UvrD-helicase domain-containing protein [Planctomycetota bacterium]HPF13253.1 UvrD-helicase domain-containing protein [Planctomycetota bacterium]
MTGAFTNRLFLASAGTGKTYRLSAHFVGLLLAGVPPERILATTFTRKAAGEILSRVLGRLVKVVVDPEEAESLSQLLGLAVDREQARRILPGLARNIHRFQVRTLDSHLSTVARLFEAELGLPPGWSIVDEVTDLDLRDEALTQALVGADEQEWLALLRGMDPSGDRRRVFEHLTQTIGGLREVFLEAEPRAWDQLPVPAGLGVEAWEGLLDQVRQFQDFPTTKAGVPSKPWVSAWEKFRGMLEAGQWEELVQHKFVEAYLAHTLTYYSKPFPPALVEIVGAALVEARHQLVENLRERNLALRGLLERFETSYSSLKRGLGQLRFDDITRLLDPLAEHALLGEGQGLSLEDVWLRLDGRLDHLLLDEFQDTSSVQWRTLQPLVEEICATHAGGEGESRTFFCVGDPKQSIYAWRHAEPRLLQSLPAELPGIDVKTLARNFRSSPLILDVCNRLFQTVAETGSFQGPGREAEADAAAQFQADYPHHEAAKVDMGGVVQLWQVRSEEIMPAATAYRACLEWAAQRVAQIRQEAPTATIGILFRSRKGIPALLHLLSTQHNLRASGEGGNPLTDSEAVSVMASLLHLADHPGDGAAAFHVVTSPLGEVLGFRASDWDLEQGPLGRSPEFRQACSQLAARVRRELVEQGYGTWMARWRGVVEGSYGAWDRVRFEQWIEICDGLARSAPLRPGQVARILRETRVPSPWSASIQAMTIHGSKGLEFDAVILPDLDSGWFQSRGQAVGSLRPDPAGRLETVSTLPAKAIVALDRTLGELAYAKRHREMLEVLNLFYVANTRARRRLEWICGPKTAELSYAHLLLERFAPGRDAVPGEGPTLVWEDTTPNHPWWSNEDTAGAVPSSDSPAAVDTTTPIHFARRPGNLQHRSPSTIHGEGEARSGEQCLAEKGEAQRGTLVHRLLESIGWLGRDLSDGLAQAWAEAGGSPQVPAAERTAVEAALASPGWAGLFEKPSDQAELYRERRFLWVEPEANTLWSGSIDRLVVEREQGVAHRAHIVDFKTGWVGKESADILAAYQDQMRLYRQAVAYQFGLPLESIRLTLAMVDRLDRIDVP